MALAAVTLRPAEPADREFLRAVYATTRADELAIVPWSDEQKAAFVEMQFVAQDVGYRQAYPEGDSSIIELDGCPIGRLFVARLADEIRVVDIALLPAYRGTGIGTRLIGSVVAEAVAAGLPVTLHVEPWSPARRLYERLGFRTVETQGIHELMEWRAPVDRGIEGLDPPTS